MKQFNNLSKEFNDLLFQRINKTDKMSKLNYSKLKTVNKKTYLGLSDMLPIIIGMILLVSIITVMIPASYYNVIFDGNIIFDSIKGAVLGSILTGNPVTGYILGNGF